MFEYMTKSRMYAYLTGIFCALIIASNILGTKTLKIEFIMLPCSILTFPMLFIVNDILSEIYGFSMARNVVYLGLFLNIITVILYSIAIMLPSNSRPQTHFQPFWEPHPDCF